VTDYVSLQSALGEIFRQEGRIDYVINCAGNLIRKNVDNMSLAEWDDLYRVNVSGNFYLAKALMPIWEQQKSGSLMLVGSSSYTRGRGGYAAYSSSKAALVNFCQALAEEVDCWNVKVNVASPGRVQTGLRFRNFGQEAPETLLSPDYVAERIVAALAVETTGSVFEIN
jgi:2-C-methyl-D-erythritol 4-phosphate cytidylyltransferase